MLESKSLKTLLIGLSLLCHRGFSAPPRLVDAGKSDPLLLRENLLPKLFSFGCRPLVLFLSKPGEFGDLQTELLVRRLRASALIHCRLLKLRIMDVQALRIT